MGGYNVLLQIALKAFRIVVNFHNQDNRKYSPISEKSI